jgi:N-acetylglucosamine kinase-like BadF-type ATPase
MSSYETTVIGIDGGGTHSIGVAADLEGLVIARARSGSLNFFGSGLAKARRNLKELTETLRRRIGSSRQTASAVVGCAALFSDATKAEKQLLCRGILPLARTRVMSDCQTAYFGATLGRPGVVVIAGTGSIVLAQNQHGQFARAGGWGHLLGDEGSAYWIAIESMKAAIEDDEGRGRKTRLSSLVRRWFKVKRLTDLVPKLYCNDFPKEGAAGLAEFLFGKLGTRDEVFRGICERGGRLLAEQARSAAERARLDLDPLPVYLVGSVLANNAVVRKGILEHLQAATKVQIENPRLAPWLGAAAMALAEAGVELTPRRVANLAKSGHTS